VLVGVPEIVTSADVRRGKRVRLQVAAGAVAAVMAVVLIVHFFVMDLDVMLAKLMRKMVL
jgi:hypothetical protein